MGLQLRTKRQADEMRHPHGRCPILASFARACPELVEGVGGDAAGATLLRSTPPVAYAVVVPALRRVLSSPNTSFTVCPGDKL